MADAAAYANWIVQNADKKGTPEFNTVVQAYQAAKAQASAPQPAPQAQPDPRATSETLGLLVTRATPARPAPRQP